MMENRRFRMIGYSGGAIFFPYWGKALIDIQGIRALERFPALREHGRDRPVGVIDRLVKGRELLAEGYFLDTTDGRESRNLIEQGYPWQASVGLWVEEAEEIKQGERGKANGQAVEGPAVIFRASELKEISFVSLGADSSTSIAVAASLGAVQSEWDQNPELRREFNHDFGCYAAYQRAMARKKPPKEQPQPFNLEAARGEWDRSPALRKEFNQDFNCYASFKQAEVKGQVRIFRR
jgi:hypothetical protein